MNKKLRFLGLLLCLIVANNLDAQHVKERVSVFELPVMYLSDMVSFHIISPEPIQYVDISTSNLIGDLPTENIARIKINQSDEDEFNIEDEDKKKHEKKSYKENEELGIITVVGQSFLVQYKILYKNKNTGATAIANIHIKAEDMQPLEFGNTYFSTKELKKFCTDIMMKKNRNPIRTERENKMEMSLNNVYVVEDYIFVDLSIKNRTNISYNIDAIKFSIDDKKVYKATNNQSVELKPIFTYNYQKDFKRNYRNIYVFKKFTYSSGKVLKIKVDENPISGRTIELNVKYKEVLNADTI